MTKYCFIIVAFPLLMFAQEGFEPVSTEPVEPVDHTDITQPVIQPTKPHYEPVTDPKLQSIEQKLQSGDWQTEWKNLTANKGLSALWSWNSDFVTNYTQEQQGKLLLLFVEHMPENISAQERIQNLSTVMTFMGKLAYAGKMTASPEVQNAVTDEVVYTLQTMKAMKGYSTSDAIKLLDQVITFANQMVGQGYLSDNASIMQQVSQNINEVLSTLFVLKPGESYSAKLVDVVNQVNKLANKMNMSAAQFTPALSSMIAYSMKYLEFGANTPNDIINKLTNFLTGPLQKALISAKIPLNVIQPAIQARITDLLNQVQFTGTTTQQIENDVFNLGDIAVNINKVVDAYNLNVSGVNPFHDLVVNQFTTMIARLEPTESYQKRKSIFDSTIQAAYSNPSNFPVEYRDELDSAIAEEAFAGNNFDSVNELVSALKGLKTFGNQTLPSAISTGIDQYVTNTLTNTAQSMTDNLTTVLNLTTALLDEPTGTPANKAVVLQNLLQTMQPILQAHMDDFLQLGPSSQRNQSSPAMYELNTLLENVRSKLSRYSGDERDAYSDIYKTMDAIQASFDKNLKALKNNDQIALQGYTQKLNTLKQTLASTAPGDFETLNTTQAELKTLITDLQDMYNFGQDVADEPEDIVEARHLNILEMLQDATAYSDAIITVSSFGSIFEPHNASNRLGLLQNMDAIMTSVLSHYEYRQFEGASNYDIRRQLMKKQQNVLNFMLDHVSAATMTTPRGTTVNVVQFGQYLAALKSPEMSYADHNDTAFMDRVYVLEAMGLIDFINPSGYVGEPVAYQAGEVGLKLGQFTDRLNEFRVRAQQLDEFYQENPQEPAQLKILGGAGVPPLEWNFRLSNMILDDQLDVLNRAMTVASSPDPVTLAALELRRTVNAGSVLPTPTVDVHTLEQIQNILITLQDKWIARHMVDYEGIDIANIDAPEWNSLQEALARVSVLLEAPTTKEDAAAAAIRSNAQSVADMEVLSEKALIEAQPLTVAQQFREFFSQVGGSLSRGGGVLKDAMKIVVYNFRLGLGDAFSFFSKVFGVVAGVFVAKKAPDIAAVATLGITGNPLASIAVAEVMKSTPMRAGAGILTALAVSEGGSWIANKIRPSEVTLQKFNLELSQREWDEYILNDKPTILNRAMDLIDGIWKTEADRWAARMSVHRELVTASEAFFLEKQKAYHEYLGIEPGATPAEEVAAYEAKIKSFDTQWSLTRRLAVTELETKRIAMERAAKSWVYDLAQANNDMIQIVNKAHADSAYNIEAKRWAKLFGIGGGAVGGAVGAGFVSRVADYLPTGLSALVTGTVAVAGMAIGGAVGGAVGYCLGLMKKFVTNVVESPIPGTNQVADDEIYSALHDLYTEQQINLIATIRYFENGKQPGARLVNRALGSNAVDFISNLKMRSQAMHDQFTAVNDLFLAQKRYWSQSTVKTVVGSGGVQTAPTETKASPAIPAQSAPVTPTHFEVD